MGQNSHIEWTDHTWNGWEGCTKVSPGCLHCYAEARNKRFSVMSNWGKGAPRRRTSPANWRQPLKWDKDSLAAWSAARGKGLSFTEPRRPRVFCASLADWLDDEVPAEWLSDLLYLIAKTSNLDWLLLTKRPQLWATRMQKVAALGDFGAQVAAQWLNGVVLPNVWIGTTVEDQERADERIPQLLSIPSKVRFLSCEPLLGNLDLRGKLCHWTNSDGSGSWFTPVPGKVQHPLIHWLICGGESGPGARPMHIDWARSLRDQCHAAGVPYFFKQWGEWMPRSQWLLSCNERAAIELVKKPKMPSAVMRRDGGIDESLGEAHTSNDADSAIYHVGKKAAGAMLDGRDWKQFPELTS